MTALARRVSWSEACSPASPKRRRATSPSWKTFQYPVVSTVVGCPWRSARTLASTAARRSRRELSSSLTQSGFAVSALAVDDLVMAVPEVVRPDRHEEDVGPSNGVLDVQAHAADR